MVDLHTLLASLSTEEFAALRALIPEEMKRRSSLEVVIMSTDGWENLSKEIEGIDLYMESGDWVWRDSEGRIRRHYGWCGSSYWRAHTLDEEGYVLFSEEFRIVEGNPSNDNEVPESDLNTTGNPLTRARVMTWGITR